MWEQPQRPLAFIVDGRLTMAYISHFALGLVVLGAIILQAVINIQSWHDRYLEPVAQGDYTDLAEGAMAFYRFITMWPFIGALFGIGRTLGDIPRDLRLALLLFLALMTVVMGILSLGPLVAIFAVAYVAAALYFSGKWFLNMWRMRRPSQRQPS